MRWFKKFDGRHVITVLLILATAGVITAGFVAQTYQYDNLLSLYAKSQAQLNANGITPTTPSAGQVAEQGAAGAKGSQGDTGKTGAAGRPPTSAEIYAQLTAYCTAHGDCIGAHGQDGAPGLSVKGDTGDTGQSIKGDPGAPGPAGADSTTPGPAGKGITSVTCIRIDVLTTAYRFTFTDGTFNDVTGNCTPTPTP
ncbi:hypothetical protein [Glaciihabitans sp. UYNi722]|uniref:hypothetical protein n=1 Tax=Glaciihabitans sp. UYNi722 TaxID=3156344 RepID=UPI003391EAF6